MPLVTEQGVVLRHQDLSGADKIISFLTMGHGKVKAVARGARRPKSLFSGSLEPLCRVEMVYFVQPDRPVLARLNSCEVMEAFEALRADYDQLIRGLYLVELTDTLLKEGAHVPSSFVNLVSALELLDAGVDADLVRWVFTWRFLTSLGYGPSLYRCVGCRSEENLVTFNPGLGGCLCSSCNTSERDGWTLSAGAKESLRLMGDISWPKVSRLTLKGEVRAEVSHLIEVYLRQHLVTQLKSATLLQGI